MSERVWNHHDDERGRWCPWSMVSAPEALPRDGDGEDERCPAGCGSARVVTPDN